MWPLMTGKVRAEKLGWRLFLNKRGLVLQSREKVKNYAGKARWKTVDIPWPTLMDVILRYVHSDKPAYVDECGHHHWRPEESEVR
jgi:hypothetical protein